MKRAVSVSLGSPKRDKKVIVEFNGVPILVERIGTGGDVEKTKNLFADLDGKVDALSVGGIDLFVRIDSKDYPVHAALKLVQGVSRTPLVDGRVLKYVLERRVFDRAFEVMGFQRHFQRAFIPFGIDRLGLIEAVCEVTDEVYIGDLMFVFGLPVPVKGLNAFKRLARLLMPIAGYLPLSMLFPPGTKDEAPSPKFINMWESADLIAGDMHYIRKYSSPNLGAKVVVTNTTTEENIETLRDRGVNLVITTTPRYQGRSFGVNMMEAVLTAYTGKGRPLDASELELLIDELDLKPEIIPLGNN